VELAKPTKWKLQGALRDEVLSIDVVKKGDAFEVRLINNDSTGIY